MSSPRDSFNSFLDPAPTTPEKTNDNSNLYDDCFLNKSVVFDATVNNLAAVATTTESSSTETSKDTNNAITTASDANTSTHSAIVEPLMDENIRDPFVQEVLQMLNPSVYFTSQAAPPSTLEAIESTPPPFAESTPLASPNTIRMANVQQGLRFRAIKAMGTTAATPPISQASINHQLDNKRRSLAARKRKYENATESRKRANKKQQQQKLGSRSQRNRGIIAESFQKDLQRAKRDIEKAEKQIANHYSRINLLSRSELQRYVAAKKDAESTQTQLLRSRDLCNALQKYFTKEKVQARIIEGSTLYGITAHFINSDNESETELFKQCFLNSNAIYLEHWNTVLSSKENWITEFGIDYAFRVPAADTKMFCERDLSTEEE